MGAYYNEFDPRAAAWLRQLIKEGLIADGEVDERSIKDVTGADLAGFTQCHFFAGIGGWSLALRRAGWPDSRPVWTGSCPCQPFSLAGAQKGFEDERHLWPEFLRLIVLGRPAKLFGEQVASAVNWFRLVRSDLEALGYAVGAMPIEAASAGADHLRDRFWFVGDDTRNRRREGRPEHGLLVRERTAVTGASSNDMANNTRPQGRPTLRECVGERIAGPDGLADTDEFSASEGRQQRGWEQRGSSGDQETCDSGVADATGSISECVRSVTDREQGGHSDYGWAIGADGKARRVKPGVRLLVNGFPSRVGLLRGFGNAIDSRPASEFIKAADEAMKDIKLVY